MFLVTQVLGDLVHGWVWGPGEEVRIIYRMLRQRRRSLKVLRLGLVRSASRQLCVPSPVQRRKLRHTEVAKLAKLAKLTLDATQRWIL